MKINERAKKICRVCGNPVADQRATYCSHRCAGLARQNYNTCVICGSLFKCPPSGKLKTCGNPDCVKRHRINISYQPQVSGSLEKGRKAYNATPKGQKGYDFHGALSWRIQAPDGSIYECHNLLHWLREHEDMLDGTPMQAWNGISKIKYSAQGKRKKPVSQWKGWKLLSWGEK